MCLKFNKNKPDPFAKRKKNKRESLRKETIFVMQTFNFVTETPVKLGKLQ